MSRHTTVALVFVGFMLFGVQLIVTRSTEPLQLTSSEQGRVKPPYDKNGDNGQDQFQPSETRDPNRFPSLAGAGKEAAGDGIFSRNPAVESHLESLLSHSDQQVRAAFEHGLELIGRGKCAEARRAFQEIIENDKDSALKGPAYWGLGLAYYTEGGTENLCLAAGRFGDFLSRFNNLQPDDLVEAAQINLAIITIELMNLGSTEQERTEAARAAGRALKTFLDRWPGSVQAAAARASLLQVQDYLSRSQQ